MPSPLSMARRRHLLALASSATLLATLPPFARPVHAAAPSGAGTSPEVGARPPRHEGVTPGSPLSADATPNSPPPLGSTAADGVFPRTIRHWAGSTTLERAPVRVAVLSTGQADGLLTLGVVPAGATRDDRGALISDYLMQAYPAFRDGIAQVADLGTRQSADVEAIAALQPDLILVNRAATPPSVLAQYQRIAPTVVTRGTGFHWRADFVLLADALGKREAAERWLRDFVQRGQTFGRWFAARKTHQDGADSARQKVAGSDGLSTGRANTTRDAATSSQGTAPGSATGSPAGSVPSSALTGISFVQAGAGRIRLMGQQSFIGDIARDMMLPRPPSQQFARTSQDIGIERIDLADGDWVFYAARGDGVKAFLDSPLWKHLDAVKHNHAVRVDYDAFYMNAGPTAARTAMDTLTNVLAPHGFSSPVPD